MKLNYDSFIKGARKFNKAFLVFFETTVNFSAIIVLFLMVYVEFQRISHGIALFENNLALQISAALAVVLPLIVVEFNIVEIEHETNYVTERKEKPSLRLWFNQFKYFVWGSAEKEYYSPAIRYLNLAIMIRLAIVFLAFSGSMYNLFQEVSAESWYDGLLLILNSDLNTMLTLVNGVLFTAAIVWIASALSHQIAETAYKTRVMYQEIAKEQQLNETLKNADVLVTNASDKIIKNLELGNKLVLEKDGVKAIAGYKGDQLWLTKVENGETENFGFNTVEELEMKMREIHNDLRSWKAR